MDSLADPESLRDREGVEWQTETRTVTQSELETARDLEHQLTVGVVNERDELLLLNDGARGWTLPVASIDRNADWDRVGRRVVESLTGVEGGLAEPVRVRCLEFRQERDPDRQVTTYNVLFRTTPVRGRPIADEPTLADEDVDELVWLEDAPPTASDGLRADIEALLE